MVSRLRRLGVSGRRDLEGWPVQRGGQIRHQIRSHARWRSDGLLAPAMAQPSARRWPAREQWATRAEVVDYFPSGEFPLACTATLRVLQERRERCPWPGRIPVERLIRSTGQYSGPSAEGRLGNYSASFRVPRGSKVNRELPCRAFRQRIGCRQLDKARSMSWMARARSPPPRAWRASRIRATNWLSLGAAVWPAATERSSARVSAISNDC